MLDDHTKILANQIDSFDLHEWYFALDARMLRENLVQPKRDSGAWVDAELVAEAQRRGLPLKFAGVAAQSSTDDMWRQLAAEGPSKR
jgi:hypothetical protein